MGVKHSYLRELVIKDKFIISNHARIITVYLPEEDKWLDYRIRSDKE